MYVIAERRWLISHGLRLAAMGVLESRPIRAAFAEVVNCAIAHGRSNALIEAEKAGLLKDPIETCPRYDAGSLEALTAAMERLKTNDIPGISSLERDQDYPIDVIMTDLTLSRHEGEGAESQPDIYLKPHTSQLQVPVFSYP